MIDQFNRINNAFGANRVKLREFDAFGIRLSILNWGEFCIYRDGSLNEWTFGSTNDFYSDTPNSRWLHAISMGKKRDEEGRVG